MGSFLIAVYLTFHSYFWELAFDNIMMGDYILNKYCNNTDGLKLAVNHKVE